jgi:hypothetical protein
MGRRIFTQSGKSREFLGSWINSGTIHEAKKRRVTPVITCSFPRGNSVATYHWSTGEPTMRALTYVFPSQCIARHTEELCEVQGNTSTRAPRALSRVETDEASSRSYYAQLSI